jgi:hypothetical protein
MTTLNPINKKNFDSYMTQEYNKKEALQAELIASGVPAFNLCIIEGDNGRADYRLILDNGGEQFEVRRDYHNNIHVVLREYKHYSNVDSYKRGEIYKAVYKSNNMKSITLKKLETKIAEELAYHAQCEKVQNETAGKVTAFMKKLEESGEEVKYYKNYDKTRITGGYIEKNGITYNFEINDNGYISENVKTHFTGSKSLNIFKALANNTYKFDDFVTAEDLPM